MADKETGNLVKVRNIRDDSNGYPTFLIYKNGCWMYKSAKHFEEDTIEERIKHGIWATSNGERLKIKNMETSHINNCINMINRDGFPHKDEYINLFNYELIKRIGAKYEKL